ncbi:MAG: hypothetical protein R3A50_14035 [Saprospiraceae bacterium]
MRKLILISLWLSCSLGALRGQSVDSLRLTLSIPAEAVFVTSDNLSNTYLISRNNAILKFDTLGRESGLFTNKRLGNATFLDAANPLKVLVWYPDFQTLVWLDRTFSEMGRLEFSKLGLYSVSAVAMSFDGNIWAFDDAESVAFKFSLEGKKLFESPPLSQYFSRRFSASRIRDGGQFVGLNDHSGGFCRLDQYGSIAEINSSLKLQDFEMEGNWMVYQEGEMLKLRNLTYLKEFQFLLPESINKEGNPAWLGKSCIYVQNGKEIEQYVWK